MKIINLLHNPSAGNEDHTQQRLVNILEKKGFKCRYSSMDKKAWKRLDEDVDFIVAAGGDGTIRKITKELLDRKLSDKTWPIALLPLGTANNIAKTLSISGSEEEIISSWHNASVKKFDVGRIYNLPSAEFFLEGFGCGIVPYLIKKMQKIQKASNEKPEVNAALKVLHDVIFSYPSRFCKLEVDGADYSGKFFLVEIMNTRLIGPNLFLSPFGDPGDGKFDIILIREKDREKLASYVANKLNGIDTPYIFDQLKGQNINITWEGYAFTCR